VVKTLLPTTDVPESYIDAYDLVLDSGDRVAGLSLTNVREILTTSELKSGDQVKILNLVIPNGLENPGGLGRNEFNVLLALVGLSQEGEEVTFDAVDERRKSEQPSSVLLSKPERC
jgi:sorting nexin-8